MSGTEDTHTTLTHAWAAFTLIEETTAHFAHLYTEHFPTWASAIAPAAEGRDAITRAPSWSPGTDTPPPDLTDEDQAASQLAALAAAIRTMLDKAATNAHHPGDRDACQRAATAAAEICALLATGG